MVEEYGYLCSVTYPIGEIIHKYICRFVHA